MDNLAGNFKGIVGLQLLHHSNHIKFNIKSIYYERAISIWNSMKIEPSIACKNDLKEEILYQNHLFKDQNGSMFKFPNASNKKSYMPLKFKLQLQYPSPKLIPIIGTWSHNLIDASGPKIFCRMVRVSIYT